jgi:diguanylate cyclase (GGDEF)-like protein
MAGWLPIRGRMRREPTRGAMARVGAATRLARLLRPLCAVVLLAAIASAAQAGVRPMRFWHLSTEEGLSQTTVLCMLQDRWGFLWLGTEDGLNRFDGYRVVVYRHDPADPHSLPGDVVWGLVEDPSGDVWVGTEGGGIARWDHLTGRFVGYRHDPANPNSISSDAVRALLIDNGQLWVGTRGAGLNRLDLRSGRVVRYRHDAATPTSLAHDDVFALARDRSGCVWVGTDDGLSLYDGLTDGFVNFRHAPSESAGLSDSHVRALAEDRQGGLWVGTTGGLNLLDRTTGRVVRYVHDGARPASLSDDRVRAILQDADGRLWVATDNALDLLDPDSGTFAVYRHDPASPDSLGSDRLMSLYQDSGGVLWVGTRTAGADRWNPATWSFGHFVTKHGDTGGLSDNNVMAFAEDARGTLYLGTMGGGLNVLNRRTGAIETFRAKSGPPAARLSDDGVMALLMDHRGALWIGTFAGGLDRFDTDTRQIVSYRRDAGSLNSIGADGVVALFEDHRGMIWVGTFGGGLSRLDPVTGRVTRIPSGTGNRAVSGSRVTCITEDRSGRLWVGTDGGGLNLLDPASGLVRVFRRGNDDPKSLSSDAVFSLYADEHNVLWIGTRGGGLNSLNLGTLQERPRFRRYSTREGLSNNVVYGILPDDDGNLWLSTNGGLTRFDVRADRFQSYGVGHGVQAAEFNFGAYYRSRAGELFFGGVNGFNAFFPGRLVKNTHPPAVRLIEILKAGKPVAMAGGAIQPPLIEFAWNDNVITFEFAALDFASPPRNQYEYRLGGSSSNWISLGTDRRVTFTDPGPGRYMLQVRAANNDGVWAKDDLTVTFDVEAAPWRRWWAYALYVSLFAGILLWVFWTQRARILREETYSAALELQVRTRTNELAQRNVELEDANTRLQNASLTDPLTGLRNRRFLFEHITKDVALVLRRSQDTRDDRSAKPVGMVLMMIDLDQFKPINDTFGHRAGDIVLLQLVRLVKSVCRESDALIRWGGDEFLLVARDTDWERAVSLAERLQSVIKGHAFDLGLGQTVRVGCSVGFASFPFDWTKPEAVTFEEVISIADQALYSAKRQRGAWVGFAAVEGTPSSIAHRLQASDPFECEAAGLIKVVTSAPCRPAAAAS